MSLFHPWGKTYICTPLLSCFTRLIGLASVLTYTPVVYHSASAHLQAAILISGCVSLQAPTGSSSKVHLKPIQCWQLRLTWLIQTFSLLLLYRAKFAELSQEQITLIKTDKMTSSQHAGSHPHSPLRTDLKAATWYTQSSTALRRDNKVLDALSVAIEAPLVSSKANDAIWGDGTEK